MASRMNLASIFARLSIAAPTRPSAMAPGVVGRPTSHDPRTLPRVMSTTPIRCARAKPEAKGKGKGKGKRSGASAEPKLSVLEQGLQATIRMPQPLWMTRTRYLRHWTIHRAWLLFRRKQRERRERTLMQQYQSMHNACDELRNTAGPGLRDEGYLYRVAMEKKGVYGHQGIPIEYARPQTETPAREAWNHDWKR